MSIYILKIKTSSEKPGKIRYYLIRKSWSKDRGKSLARKKKGAFRLQMATMIFTAKRKPNSA